MHGDLLRTTKRINATLAAVLADSIADEEHATAHIKVLAPAKNNADECHYTINRGQHADDIETCVLRLTVCMNPIDMRQTGFVEDNEYFVIANRY